MNGMSYTAYTLMERMRQAGYNIVLLNDSKDDFKPKA